MSKLHDDPTRTTALGMARYGYEFLGAAFAVDNSVGNKNGHEVITPIPVLYLVGHGIELSLKAYMLQHKLTLGELKGLGHNLSSCFDRAKKLGLLEIVSFDELYSTKQLEYIVTGAKQFPMFGPLQLFGVKLFNAVANSVSYRERFYGFIEA
jgi:hypothetical protein